VPEEGVAASTIAPPAEATAKIAITALRVRLALNTQRRLYPNFCRWVLTAAGLRKRWPARVHAIISPMARTVDEYVEESVLPEHRDTVAMLRALVRETAPRSEEAFSYGMPVFKVGPMTFAWILANPRYTTFSFREGIQIEDRHKLLKGTGKHARHIKLKAADSVDRDVLRYYIKAALAIDAA